MCFKLSTSLSEHRLARLWRKTRGPGAIVDVYEPDALEVEFVTASSRTKALVTLKTSDVRDVKERAKRS